MENNENNGNNSNKGKIFAVVCAAGFVLILIFVPRLVTFIGMKLGRVWGWKLGLLFVALFWTLWCEACLYYKNQNNIK